MARCSTWTAAAARPSRQARLLVTFADFRGRCRDEGHRQGPAERGPHKGYAGFLPALVRSRRKTANPTIAAPSSGFRNRSCTLRTLDQLLRFYGNLPGIHLDVVAVRPARCGKWQRVRHAYFLGANDPYSALKTTLKAEINEEAWATLNSDTSRAFPKPESGRIAVKVINHLGDEVMKVFKVE